MERHGANVGVTYVGPSGEKKVLKVEADHLPAEDAEKIVAEVVTANVKKKEDKK